TWTTELPQDGPQLPFILHLSCMAHYTPHVPFTAQRILQKMDIACPILGGPENCCGTLHEHFGDRTLAQQTARIGITGFRRAKPTTVLSICPDCDEMFSKHMPQSKSFHHSNVSELFIENLDRLKPLMRRLDRRVVVHIHDHNDSRKRDAENVETILGAIPGVEIVKANSRRGPGAHCQILAPMPKDEQSAMFDEAVALGADTLVMPYHSCYRQHIKMELQYPIKVEHYLSVLGAAVGVEVEETYKRLRLLDDVDKSVAALRSKFEPLGYTDAQIRPLVEWAIYC
ncbi:MAG: heterodisulfide reductase-related iron-sulfur binding cluster, partial [Burkholderiales bacterium]